MALADVNKLPVKCIEMENPVKIWGVVEERYWVNEDGDVAWWKSEYDARRACKEEGFKDEYIDYGIEFHPYYNLDTTGYDLK